jgi:hypothetical protein
MFRTDLLSIIRRLNTVFTAIGICHTSYVDCLLARSGFIIRIGIPHAATDAHQTGENIKYIIKLLS